MIDVDSARPEVTAGRSYFFLSYAHSLPIEGDLQADPDEHVPDPDEHVREFFHDLADAVSRRAPSDSGRIPGFFDQHLPPGSDWKEGLRRALGATEVFIPLYSPGYVARSLPRREYACFYQRLVQAGEPNPAKRIAPVLWTPLRDTGGLPGLDAAFSVDTAAAEYRKNGLRALRKITPYGDSYRRIVNELAERIVTLAEEDPLIPSAAPDIDQTTSTFGPRARLAVLALAVAAPTLGTLPAYADAGRYADTSAGWRPFAGQQLSLAKYAQQVAERLDFGVKITSLATACNPSADKPGIVLIDPWYVATEPRRAELQAALSAMPRWVLPLLVQVPSAGQLEDQLAQRVRRMLGTAPTISAGSSRRGRRSVSSLAEFAAVVPAMVAEAERQYLRYGGGYPPLAQPGGRLRLTGPAQPGTPDPALPDSPGETPDA